MFNAVLAGDLLYGKWLFAWLSLVMSSMVSYFFFIYLFFFFFFFFFFFCCPFSDEMSW